MAIQLFGRWNLRVTKAIRNWQNRFIVQGAASGDGTYPPTVGLDVNVDGTSWLLMAEYRESNAVPWKPSAMMIRSPPSASPSRRSSARKIHCPRTISRISSGTRGISTERC